jgi:predicted DsbA family dithiol-disulfide isomerase
MRVEIFADVDCPWSFMAKRRFEWALAVFDRRDELDVVLRPFQLNPTAPSGWVPNGSRDASVRAAAAQGIDYRPEQVVHTDTLPAHRLIWLAGEGGSIVARRVMDRIFLAHLTEGRNIADPDTLADIAGRSRMQPERVRGFLATDEGASEVRAQVHDAQERGIDAVPTFVFGNGRVVVGALESLAYLELLEELARDSDDGVTRVDEQVSAERSCA